MYINSNTPLKNIKITFYRDYGLLITNEQAKEVRNAHRTGAAHRTKVAYRNTSISSPDIKKCDKTGVWATAYGTFWTRKEWNAEYREVAMKEAKRQHIPEINPDAFNIHDLEAEFSK